MLCDGIESAKKKKKVVEISREPSPVLIIVDKKQLENGKYFNYRKS
jgi:hypothetical protein